MTRPSPWLLALGAALLCSACVITPGRTVHVNESAELARMSEQALKTCGEGQVKEVSAKAFSCK